VKDYVTPIFYQYLQGEYAYGRDYKPVYKIDMDGISLSSVHGPHLLLGEPLLFNHLDTVKFIRSIDDPFFVKTERNNDIVYPQIPKWTSYVWVSYGPASLVGRYMYPARTPKEIFGWRYWKNMLSILVAANAYRKSLEEGKDVSAWNLPKLWHLAHNFTTFPGEEGSLAYIVDITFKARVGMQVEKWNARLGKEEILLKKDMESTTFCVTFRSNHVTPGWKLNSDTVRWSIDDINFARRLKSGQVIER
jgi:hypothetical protein